MSTPCTYLRRDKVVGGVDVDIRARVVEVRVQVVEHPRQLCRKLDGFLLPSHVARPELRRQLLFYFAEAASVPVLPVAFQDVPAICQADERVDKVFCGPRYPL